MASDQDRFDSICMTLTPRGIPGLTSEDAPGVKLTDGQEKFRELVHVRSWPLARLTIPLGGLSKQMEGLASKLIGSLRDIAFRSWLPTGTGCTQWKNNPDSHALDMDLG